MVYCAAVFEYNNGRTFEKRIVLPDLWPYQNYDQRIIEEIKKTNKRKLTRVIVMCPTPDITPHKFKIADAFILICRYRHRDIWVEE